MLGVHRTQVVVETGVLRSTGVREPPEGLLTTSGGPLSHQLPPYPLPQTFLCIGTDRTASGQSSRREIEGRRWAGLRVWSLPSPCQPDFVRGPGRQERPAPPGTG